MASRPQLLTQMDAPKTARGLLQDPKFVASQSFQVMAYCLGFYLRGDITTSQQRTMGTDKFAQRKRVAMTSRFSLKTHGVFL